MKKVLLIVGVIVIIACIISLLYAMLNFSAFKSLRDGTAEHYERLHRNAVMFAVIGIILFLIGAAFIVISFKVL